MAVCVPVLDGSVSVHSVAVFGIAIKFQVVKAAAAEPLVGDGATMTARDQFIAERWDTFRALARHWLRESRLDALPDLPPLTADQRRPVNHGLLRAPRIAPPGRFTPARA